MTGAASVVRDLFVTGSMGSGTMYTSKVLEGTWQNHSEAHNVLVSWFSRSDVFSLLDGFVGGGGGDGDGDGDGDGATRILNLYWDDNSVQANHMNYLNQHFYKQVRLQVRHPLRVFTSGIFAFQDEGTGWFSYEKWDRLICIEEGIVGAGEGGGVCDESFKISSAITGLMDFTMLSKIEKKGWEPRKHHVLYLADRWVRWNEYAMMVLPHYQLERGVGVGGEGISKNINAHKGDREDVSWEELEAADYGVYVRVIDLARRMGYEK